MSFNNYYVEEMKRRIEDGFIPSKAFISIYLNLFHRLDYGDERDYICDMKNDKGIDGIYINDELEEIYFIQSKFGDSDESTSFKSIRKIGEKEPSHFIGSVEKFRTREGLQTLLDSEKIASRIKDLIKELNLIEKTNYEYRLIFITNGEHNQDSKDVESSTDIEFFLLDDFEKEYIQYINIIESTNSPAINFEFYPIDKNIIKTSFDSYICLMKVKDLVKIDGINDYSVFSENVRGWLGRNRVFKAIAKNLNDEEYDQSKNILYHNGITILSSSTKKEGDKIIINDLSIVNGCQSTYAFYKNKDKLLNRNHVLVKIISLADHPTIDKKNIVHYSNNQIAVKASDLVSLSDNSKYIQNIFLEKDSDYHIKIKEGNENIDVNGKSIIKLSLLAQYIASFYNVGHQRASNKNNLIETSYYEVFNGIDYEHMKIALIISKCFDDAVSKLKENETEDQKKLLTTYHLTKLFSMTSLKHIYLDIHKLKTIDFDKKFNDFIDDTFKSKLVSFFINLLVDLTSYLTVSEQLIEYRSILKTEDKSSEIVQELKKEYQKNILKNNDYSINF